jgi:3-methyl-2-oxobutanoate hydroxymethyltransferase
MPFTISQTAAEEAGFNTRKVRFDPKSPVSAIAVRKAAPSTFTTFCTGLTKVATVNKAVRGGFDAMEAGADGVLCQWGPDFIRAVRGGGYCIRMTARLADHRSFTRGLCCKALLRQLI